MRTPVSNVWLAIDMDGTLCEDGHYPDFGKPKDGASAAMHSLKAMGFSLMIWTNRTAKTALNGDLCDPVIQHKAIEDWCKKHDIPFDYIDIDNKPVFVYAFVDNKAIRYDDKNGGWFGIIGGIERDLIDRGINPWGDKSEHIKELCK